MDLIVLSLSVEAVRRDACSALPLAPVRPHPEHPGAALAHRVGELLRRFRRPPDPYPIPWGVDACRPHQQDGSTPIVGEQAGPRRR